MRVQAGHQKIDRLANLAECTANLFAIERFTSSRHRAIMLRPVDRPAFLDRQFSQLTSQLRQPGEKLLCRTSSRHTIRLRRKLGVRQRLLGSRTFLHPIRDQCEQRSGTDSGEDSAGNPLLHHNQHCPDSDHQNGQPEGQHPERTDG